MSSRGACVALAEGRWFESEKNDEQQAGFPAESAFEHLMRDEALRDCVRLTPNFAWRPRSIAFR